MGTQIKIKKISFWGKIKDLFIKRGHAIFSCDTCGEKIIAYEGDIVTIEEHKCPTNLSSSAGLLIDKLTTSNYKDMKEKIKELEKRIQELEKRPQHIPFYHPTCQPQYNYPMFRCPQCGSTGGYWNVTTS